MSLSGDLFDTLPDHAAPGKPVRIKKSGLYAAMPGTGPAGETCRTCKHFCRQKQSKTWFKCGLCRPHWTGGIGTDIRAGSPACSKWEAA